MRIAVCRRRCRSRAAAPRSSPTTWSRSSARAATRPTSSRSRSSGIRASACSRRRSSGGCSTSRRSTAGAVDLVIATKFPSYVVRHPNKVVWLVHQFRQAYELDRTDARPVRRVARGSRDRGARCSELDKVALGEARKALRDLAERRRPTRSARPGSTAEVMPAPAAGARPTTATSTATSSSRSAGSTVRSGSTCCSRPLAADPRSKVVIAGDGPDRERLELARDTAGRSPSPAGSPRTSSPTSTRRCLAVFYAPVDEDFGMVPYEAFLVGEAGRDDDRRGRAARSRHRPRHRARHRAAGRRRSRPPSAGCSTPGRRRDLGPGGQGARRARHLGRDDRPSCSREGRLLLAAAADAVRASPTTPRCSCPRSRSASTSSSPAPDVSGAARGATSRSTTSATTRTSTAGSSTRSAAGPASSSSTSSYSTTSSPASPSPAVTSTATCAALEREVGLEGRLPRARACRQGEIEPLWETRPDGVPARRRVLDLATALIVHSQLRGGARTRRPASPGRSAQVPMPAWPVPHVEAEPIEGRPGRRLLRSPEREQANPAAPGGVLAPRSGRAPPPGRIVVAAPRPRARAPGARDPTGLRPGAASSGRCSQASDVVVSLRFPTMGETSAATRSRALAR